MTTRVEGSPRDIQELVISMEQRRVFRRMHELGDEGVALALEAAGIKEGDVEVESAARSLRQHLMEGGTAATFLDKFPQFRRVNFNHLDLTITLAEVIQGSLLLGPGRASTGEDIRALPAVATDRPRLELSDSDQLKAAELFEKYPGVIALFSEEERWIEDGHGRLIQKSQFQALLVSRRPNVELSDSYRTTKMNDLWIRWKLHNPDVGRKIKGKGPNIFLTGPEAVNFLWFIHEKISSSRSTSRGVTLSGFAPELPKKKL